jgi:hypothetical protein
MTNAETNEKADTLAEQGGDAGFSAGALRVMTRHDPLPVTL